MKMRYVSTRWVGTTVSASWVTQEMGRCVKHFAKMGAGMEEPVLLPTCVPAHKASLAPAVKLTLMNALMALCSVTAVLIASICQGGTTVNAGMATMTMGCFHQVENPVKTLMNVQLEGIAVPMTLFALTWMVGMTVDVHMARIAQETVSMKTKSSTMVRFGCWRTTDALSAHARVDT